jgi:outer membrane protein W
MGKLRFSVFLAIAFFSMNVMAESSYLQEIFSKPDKRWMVRVRAVYLQMAHESDPIPTLGVPGGAIEIRDIFIPELDISFFFTKHIAAELVLTYAQKHELHFNNSAIGPFK